MKLNKKGQVLGLLGNVFQQLLFIGMLGAIIVIIFAQLYSSTSNTDAKNAIQNATVAVGNTFAQFPLFGTILGLMLILGLVFLVVRGREGSMI